MNERNRHPKPALLVTCEHGGARVPARYARLFDGHAELLASHRGWDPGALEVAQRMARRLGCPLFHSTTTRLLIELNRSEHNPRIRSAFTRQLPAAEVAAVLERYHRPYWRAVHDWIAEQAARRRVIHVSSHSFTPVLNGQTRTADVGLLYDPRRPIERRLARRWKAAIRERRPELRVRFNYPYLGIADGLTTALRRRFDAERYAGMELELNQTWVGRDAATWKRLYNDVIGAFEVALPLVVNERSVT